MFDFCLLVREFISGCGGDGVERAFASEECFCGFEIVRNSSSLFFRYDFG